jgi:hypothetical protein
MSRPLPRPTSRPAAHEKRAGASLSALELPAAGSMHSARTLAYSRTTSSPLHALTQFGGRVQRGAAPLVHGGSGLAGMSTASWRQLQSLQSMHALYQCAQTGGGAPPAAGPKLDKAQKLATLMIELSKEMERGKANAERVYSRLLEAKAARYTINTWVSARHLVGNDARSFDVLWYQLVRAHFDVLLDYRSHDGEWARVLAELLLGEHVAARRGDTALRGYDALIRAEVRALSIADSAASPQQIVRLLEICPRLERLDLSRSRATDATIADAIRLCPELRYVRLTDTRIDGDAIDMLVAALPGIEIDI